MDLLSTREEKCATVSQASLNADDLDDMTVTFGVQTSDKENFDKIHYGSLFEQESSTEEEMSYSEPGITANEPHMLLDILEKILFAVNKAHGAVKQMKNQLGVGGGGGWHST